MWRGRRLLGAAVVVLACLVPPLSGTARRYEYGEALQFPLLAIVAPALVAARPHPRDSSAWPAGADAAPLRLADRVAERRRRHP